MSPTGNNPADPADPTDRAHLAERNIPHMRLADGTGIRADDTPYDASWAASLRFRVDGGALVTGGAGVLGLAVARALLEHGAAGVVLLDLASSLESAAGHRGIRALAADFPAAAVQAAAVDTTSAEATMAAVDDAQVLFRNRGSRLRHLLCFAGIVNVTPSLAEDPARFRRVMDVNASGAFVAAQAFGRVWQLAALDVAGSERDDASVVFMASLAAGQVLFPQPQAAYNASKAAVVALAKSLAAEWANSRIRVNVISPGYMDTVLNEGAGLETARREWMARCPMGRMGKPEELAGAAVLLCSRAGRYMTGAEIKVDGGSSVF